MTARVCVLTLGCPKNLVDSEHLMGALERRGYRLVLDPQEADAVVVNTCAFIEDAVRESIEQILEVAELKSTGQLEHLIVAGCLAERHGGELLREMPEVDGAVGPGCLSQVGPLLDRLRAGADGLVSVGTFEGLDAVGPRVRTGSPHTAYVKISEGCDHRCCYCLIPSLRGPQRSRRPQAILAEARALAAEGARELILVAQDTTAYGRDLDEPASLAMLLRSLDDSAGPDWIRVMYTHPRHWNEELIEVFASGRRLVPYVDLPVQHIADPVLKAMGRGHDGRRTRRLVRHLRRAIARLVLRTTVLTGHPGEGPDEFAELLDFLREFPFDRLGAFAYSREDGTRSAELQPQTSSAVAAERRARVLELQRGIAFTLQQGRKGAPFDLLVEGVQPEKGYAVGRTYAEAPDVDGVVYLKAARVPSPAVRHAKGDLVAGPDLGGVEPGDLVPVRIIGAGPYDSVAALRDEARSPDGRGDRVCGEDGEDKP
jgi:ribosomal protein S12 methylthiotransferase